MGMQGQKFGIATYQAPSGWKEEKSESHVSYTKTVGSDFGQIALYGHVKSKGDIQADFDAQWKELIANGKEISAPDKTKPVTANGWTAMSGSGTWTFNGANVATLLTVYSNQKVCVSVLVNFTDPDLAKGYVTLLESLTLDASKATVSTSPTANAAEKSSLAGLWVFYNTESRGVVNGIHQLTAGYFRREYLLKSDGTYTFRAKDWSVFVADILFVYEVGNWSVSGSQITLKPTKGSGSWWGKAESGRTVGWGKLKKSSTFKLETVTYTFDLTRFEGNQESVLILKSSTPTQRDYSSSGNAKVHEWRYTSRELSGSLIDNPPGFVAPAAPKASAESASAPKDTKANVLSGRHWEGVSLEKYVAGGTNMFHTGGFFSARYRFNADGTYQFFGVLASNILDGKTFQYETGNYTVSGNQLTISPKQGTNEEWSKNGKTSNGNSEIRNREINETWGKKLKTLPRKLDKVTYAFRIEYLVGNKANTLILEFPEKNTREDTGKMTYYFETPTERLTPLPPGVK